ncbi:MAG TPA: DUF2007 domain-containing protein [Bacillota bacterium]|nr:DUF2007 domain-containing protein [Bacillota bacterium]
MKMTGNIVTLATFIWPYEAHLLRMRLEAYGIPCFVGDENIVILNWSLSNAVWGVKVLIKSEDLAEAKQILEMEPTVVEKCPECSSPNVYFKKFFGSLLALSWLIGFPLPFFINKWRCKDCGNQWQAM